METQLVKIALLETTIVETVSGNHVSGSSNLGLWLLSVHVNKSYKLMNGEFEESLDQRDK